MRLGIVNNPRKKTVMISTAVNIINNQLLVRMIQWIRNNIRHELGTGSYIYKYVSKWLELFELTEIQGLLTVKQDNLVSQIDGVIRDFIAFFCFFFFTKRIYSRLETNEIFNRFG